MRGAMVLLIVAMLGQVAQTQAQPPKIGDTVPEMRFKDIRALPRTLADLGKKRAYVFVFTTTSCPLVRRSIPKLIDLDSRYSPQDVQFVAVNVGADDTIRGMAAQAIELDAAFAFVKDVDLSCAKALGVTRTPGVAVLDADRKLVYRGRIDDQLRLGGARPEPTRRDLEEAIRETLAGQGVSVAETAVDGCTIEAPLPPSTTRPDATYHQDVAPILQRRCINCHVEGTAAPFALLTYRDAVSHAEMIAEVVADQRMPPWFANPKHGKFQNDPSLSTTERETIANWVRSGRAEGDAPEIAAEPTKAITRWRIGEPDLIVTMLEEHAIPATGFVPYRNALLPHVFLADTWVEAFEIRPQNPAVVHHCNMAFVTPKGAGEHTFITGHVPGGQPMDMGRFDNGSAILIPKLAALGLQIHYTTTGKEETCRIQVGLRFPRRPVQKQLRHLLLDPHRIAIPPGHGAFAIQAGKTLDRDITLMGMFSHMHVRGKDMSFFAVAPDKSRETLLQIPNYNFEWQLGYEIEPGQKRLPKGTMIEAIAHYDNSAFNPYNPDAKRTVPWGQQTYDEMFNGFVFFVDDTEQLGITVNPKNGQIKR
ncbi:MAG: thiol-disulfide oxidoreductase [Schlesneria sp.]|nr:thiol-disulfide oxidoreductase [Schlesneria sp.]